VGLRSRRYAKKAVFAMKMAVGMAVGMPVGN
jgi:hypothetical protein